MQPELKLGMVGLDTSHSIAFADLLHSPQHPFHVPGGRIVGAYPGGSRDFPASIDRVDGFTKTIREQFGVEIVDSPEAVAERCDAVLLVTGDVRRHLEQFRRIAPAGKPVFIDKPFAVSTTDARQMVALAGAHAVPLLTCSPLRYAEALQTALADTAAGAVIGADFYGPMHLEPTQPGLFWYGIHAVEMLYATLGAGCREVSAVTAADHDVATGRWADGRLGVVRGNRKGNGKFGGLIHREKATTFVDALAHPKPFYASLVERIMQMFRTRIAPIPLEESVELVRFIEAANESRSTGKPVAL